MNIICTQFLFWLTILFDRDNLSGDIEDITRLVYINFPLSCLIISFLSYLPTFFILFIFRINFSVHEKLRKNNHEILVYKTVCNNRKYAHIIMLAYISEKYVLRGKSKEKQENKWNSDKGKMKSKNFTFMREILQFSSLYIIKIDYYLVE